jgi:mRNA interferase RelE/StbE
MTHRVLAETTASVSELKLRSAGYRLVYEVRDAEWIVLVLAVGQRERSAVYAEASKR